MQTLSAGVQAPDFELKTTDGESFHLETALESGPVLLAFYKAACPTCQLAFPFIQRIYAGFGRDSGLTIWGISQDEPDETRAFQKKFGLEFPILIDEHPYAVSSKYRLSFVPTLFLVSRDSSIELSDYGFSKSTLNQIAEFAAQRTNRPSVRLFRNDDGVPESRPG